MNVKPNAKRRDDLRSWAERYATKHRKSLLGRDTKSIKLSSGATLGWRASSASIDIDDAKAAKDSLIEACVGLMKKLLKVLNTVSFGYSTSVVASQCLKVALSIDKTAIRKAREAGLLNDEQLTKHGIVYTKGGVDTFYVK